MESIVGTKQVFRLGGMVFRRGGSGGDRPDFFTSLFLSYLKKKIKFKDTVVATTTTTTTTTSTVPSLVWASPLTNNTDTLSDRHLRAQPVCPDVMILRQSGAF